MRWLWLLILCFWPVMSLGQSDSEARDRGILQSFLEDNLSAMGRQVRIEGFAGALSGRATIDTLTIADDEGVWITLRGLVLDWNRAALLRGSLEVTELSAEEVDLPRLPRGEERDVPEPAARGPFELPELPVAVHVDAFKLARVALGAPLLGEEVTLAVDGEAQLESGEGTADLSIRRTDGARGELTLSGQYVNETRHLSVDLALEEAANGIAARLLDLPGRPALELRIAGDAPLDDFAAEVALRTDGIERLSGAVTVRSTGEAEETGQAVSAREIGADLRGDLAPLFAPDFAPFFGDEIALVLTAREMPDGRRVLDTLDLTARALRISAKGAIAADGWPETLSLTGTIADPETGRVLLPAGAGGVALSGAEITARYDRAAGEGWQFDARADGVELDDNRIGRLSLTAQGALRVPQDGTTGAVTGELSLDADGVQLADDAMADAVGSRIGGDLSLNWEEGAPLTLTGLTLQGEDYGVSGEVALSLSGEGLEIPTTLDLTLDARDLGRFSRLAGRSLAGAAKLAIAGNVSPVAGTADLRVRGTTSDLALDQPQIDPLLEGDASLRFGLVRDTDGSRVEDLLLQSDHARISGAARLGPADGEAELNAEIENLSRVIAGAEGPAQLALEATGQEGRWQVNGTTSLPGGTELRFDATLTGLNGDDPQITGRLTGQIDSIAPYSDVAGRPLGGAAEIEADVSASLDTLAGQLSLELRTRDLVFDSPSVDPLLRGEGVVSARLTRATDGRLNAEEIVLDTPEVLARLSGTMTDSTQEVKFEANLRNAAVIVPDLGGPISASGTARRGSGDWEIEFDGSGPGGAALSVTGELSPDVRRGDLQIRGAAPLGLANARLRPRSLSGMARFDLALNGPLAPGSLSGNVTVQGARVTLPSLFIALGEIDAEARLSGGQARITSSGTVSTGGRFSGDGVIGLTPPFNADLSLTLTEVVLRQARLYQTSASGNVTVQGALAGGARIGGELTLGTAELRLSDTSVLRYSGLPGLVHINEPADVRRVREWAGLLGQGGREAAGPAYPLDLLIRAPSRIFVRGRGLDAELGGQLRLGGTTADIQPSGRFELVRGRFDILGKRLTLTEGLLTLQGAFDPFVRFAATTDAEGVAIRLAIEGLASAPELTLTSVPELPQDEILSLLLFGRDATRISPLQAVRLASALRTLSGAGGTGVTGQLRRTFALDDLDVTTDESGNVEARAGKYLSENIYSEVSVNGAGETEINLNLQVSPDITARGRLGEDGETGIGLFFERDY
ncbi:autotransporter secretion inner membrane protein TamB [Salinihabitans flavidus]|uniref:Autotransporter secretion inner membrane protein TamB n=1 Tax=Salinihabitans flavidus TaxID=569882 RepID=A0A1H8PRL0_9RHOB|nr:translocation/assembly module TamB domain-containing protein [Salinihabitans flavidus]SEO44555.1 autotransporter secretion inner membrane protein TamB [Salinihabitans flavidus]